TLSFVRRRLGDGAGEIGRRVIKLQIGDVSVFVDIDLNGIHRIARGIKHAEPRPRQLIERHIADWRRGRSSGWRGGSRGLGRSTATAASSASAGRECGGEESRNKNIP